MKNILVVAAHPDDEVIGVGASLYQWASEGMSITCLFVSDGESSRETATDADVSARKTCCHNAVKILGVDECLFLDYPDNKLDSIPLLSVAKDIQKVIDKVKPDTVLTHHDSDLNIDHRLTLEAVLIATRPVPGSVVRRVISFETPSATGWRYSENAFSPNWWVPLSNEDWNKKEQALLCYRNEIPEAPHSRSISALNALSVFRGSQVGFERAEGFCILRSVGSLL